MMVVLTTTMLARGRIPGRWISRSGRPAVRADQVQYWKVMSEIPMNGVPSTVPSWP